MRYILALITALVVTACAPPPASSTPTLAPEATSPQTPATLPPETLTAIEDEALTPTPLRYTHFGVTSHRFDGNRLVEGAGRLPEGTTLDVQVGFRPEWVVAVPHSAGGGVWVAVSAEGAVAGYRVTADGEARAIPMNVESLPPGSPPLLAEGDEDVALITYPDMAPLTHPVPINGGDFFAYVTTSGTLSLVDAMNTTRNDLPLDTLPDARLVTDEDGRILVLTGPTESYRHNVLGDPIEARGVAVIETVPALREVLRIQPEEGVIEGTGPMWADVTGDGQREIIVTVSNREVGAEVRAYDEAGNLVASGPAIGQGFRWRHQLTVIPVEGTPRLVEVLTPHLGRLTGFYTVQGDELALSGQLTGYTSHVIGRRNLDMAVAGDFDGDGQVEVVLPSAERSTLGAVRFDGETSTVAWTLALPSTLESNLFALEDEAGRLWLSAGLADGTLRIWQP